MRAVRNLSLHLTRSFLSHPSHSKPTPSSSTISNVLRPISSHLPNSTLRFFSSESDDQNPKPEEPESSSNEPEVKESSVDKPEEKEFSIDDVPDVDNADLKMRIEKYFKGDDEALTSVFDAIMQRSAKKTT